MYVISVDSAKWQCVGESGATFIDTPLPDSAANGGISSRLEEPPFDGISTTNPGNGRNPDFKSMLVPKDAMERYVHAAKRLRADWKRILLEDHVWSLKSWDHDSVYVVKIFYGECKKEFRSMVGNHKAVNIQNLFANLKKSYLMCTAMCRTDAKGRACLLPSIYNQLQRRNLWRMTVDNHKHAVLEGLKTMIDMNDNEGLAQPSFELVGDPDSPKLILLLFWVRCRYNRDFFQLCPSRGF